MASVAKLTAVSKPKVLFVPTMSLSMVFGTHTSGMPAFRPFYQMGITTRQGVVDAVLGTDLENEPGVKYVYSDFSMITLALVVEKITGQNFAMYTREHIFEPLGMYDTGYRPTGKPDPTVVPTEVDDYFRNRLIQGEVHDENAWLLDGVAGRRCRHRGRS